MSDKEKKCFKCGQVKSLSEFYKHKGCVDGCLNKCKCCTKSDVAAHRSLNIERIREYDRARGARQEPEYLVEYRGKYPKSARAHRMVAYHLRAGNITKSACEVCGDKKSVAHHDDYDKPLVVRWMCQAHHKQWHEQNGPGLNQA